MSERKIPAVNVSITEEEFQAIYDAFGEYSSKAEGCSDPDSTFMVGLELDLQKFSNFEAKYKKAIRSKFIRKYVNEGRKAISEHTNE